ncbi:unnamed protein product [Thelazia callipaeda]|uniref:Protein FAM98A n=1 Tax=Thelazia callipaeda TaxID=103827 RepID=A0A0N5D7K8_THECL|nr:unnamed protein product [Thelazia callipaeda]
MVSGGLEGEASVAEAIFSSGFKGFPLEKWDEIHKAGIDDLRFCKLVEWLCNEISVLYGLDETVHAPTGPDDMEFFLLELSSLLSELECPVVSLTSGPVMKRFKPVENVSKLLNFLIGHMKCARLTALNRLQEKSQVHKTDEVRLLENAMATVGMNELPANLTAENAILSLKDFAEKQLAKCKEKPQPLFTASLTNAQWKKIENLNEKLIHEYRARIMLLLKRLDVTIQSFTWSDRVRKMQDQVHELYRPRRDAIVAASDVEMHDLLSANRSLLIVDKVNSEKERKRTATRLNKVLMADRPGDRGGRPSELRPPPPEMPPWMKDRAPSHGGSVGGYQGGGGYQGNAYQRGGGGYQGSGGGYQGSGWGYQGSGRNQGRGYQGNGQFGSLENQVMREYEERHGSSNDGRRSRGGRGRGGFSGQYYR